MPEENEISGTDTKGHAPTTKGIAMSEQQEQQGTQYSPEQFEEVRRARHAVRGALSKFYHVLQMVDGVDTHAVTRLSGKAKSAMRGRVGFTQEQQVERFDWVTEDVEGIVALLNEVEVGDDEFAVKVLDLANVVLTAKVTPLVAEGRKIAAERDWPAYKAAKDAYRNRGRGYGYTAPVVEDDDDEDDEDDEG